MNVGVGVDLPPPIVMKLDPQGPPVSYANAASRQPQKKGVTGGTAHMCDVHMRDVIRDKEKVGHTGHLGLHHAARTE